VLTTVTRLFENHSFFLFQSAPSSLGNVSFSLVSSRYYSRLARDILENINVHSFVVHTSEIYQYRDVEENDVDRADN